MYAAPHKTLLRLTSTNSSPKLQKSLGGELQARARLKEQENYRIVAIFVTEGGFNLNNTDTSIFDLSPSEKLQLVEDLWDDLAATPGTVPMHEWQKEELARRRTNLMKNPASGLTWEEVKKRVRSPYGR
jgi:putative addiction module component (TIGR02574 family)